MPQIYLLYKHGSTEKHSKIFHRSKRETATSCLHWFDVAAKKKPGMPGFF